MTARVLLFGFTVSVLVACQGNEAERPLFESLSPQRTGVDFQNDLEEDEEFNIVEYLYFYNGAGVAIGDINNDGWNDLFFVSNQGSNKLFINKGNWNFQDITPSAGLQGVGNWKTGVAMADVNGDGWLDLYVCGVGGYKKYAGRNQLYINQGDLTFREASEEMGLAFQGFSTHAAFFDFDRDGDLDMYLLNHSVHSVDNYGSSALRSEMDDKAGDQLYRNELVPSGVCTFTNVTHAMGIYSSAIGYGLGIGISDVNRDGYPDIYISNDFHENDYLYLNEQGKKFVEVGMQAFTHTSRFSMGNDMADVNNDLWPDIVSVDMLPKDEQIIKSSAGEDSYEVWSYKLNHGFQTQVSRNSLQINKGLRGRVPQFVDHAPLMGVFATDWSWSPLFFDADGDGLKDLFVSNGIQRRPNDLDYMSFIYSDSVQRKSRNRNLDIVRQMPGGSARDYFFTNKGDHFVDQSISWGMQPAGLSNGAAYGDLDNDGDPDLVVSRVNESALLYRNQSDSGRFLSLSLRSKPGSRNVFAMGARIELNPGRDNQSFEVYTSRGWCSSSSTRLMVGGISTDSILVKITWPDGTCSSSTLGNSGQHQTIEQPADARCCDPSIGQHGWFTPDVGFSYRHQENDFNAFSRESLMPFMLTAEGPAMAVGDLDGDSLPEVFVGSARGKASRLFSYRPVGKWQELPTPEFLRDSLAEDVDAGFTDVDRDGDLDLVVVSGGHEESENKEPLRPRLYLNNGHGQLEKVSDRLPGLALNASCVRPIDYDVDGDVDLFIGGSVVPYLYGMPPPSYLLRNIGNGYFEVVSDWLGDTRFDNVSGRNPGMVQDAVWADLNNDGLPDLILAGEWMPVTVLIQNDDHSFSNRTEQWGLDETSGLWKSILAADMDKDGDLDLMVGNLGLNGRLTASRKKPLLMYLGDFDSNQSSDHILVYYNGEKSYPFASRDQLVRQLPTLKKKFLHYRDYHNVALEDIITPLQKGNSAVLRTDMLESVVMWNNNGKFSVEKLPLEAQAFPVFSMLCGDFNRDGKNEVLLGGNLTNAQPEIGPYDAGLAVVLTLEEGRVFKAVPPMQSGLYIRGNIRSMKDIKLNDQCLVIVGRNNDTCLLYEY